MPNQELTLPALRPSGPSVTTSQRDAQVGLAIGAAVLTVALTAVSFWLSYESLHDLARAHRLQGERAWAWPATVDAFIAIGELLILRASLARRVDPWAIALTAAGSLGSIALNVAGVGVSDDLLDYVTAAVPPVAALLAFGVLMRQVHDFLLSRQPSVTLPLTPVTVPVIPLLKEQVSDLVEEPETVIPDVELEPVTTADGAREPLTQRQQIDAVVRGLYNALGKRRPGTRHMRDALRQAGLPSSDGTCRESRKRVEKADPDLKDLPEALAA